MDKVPTKVEALEKQTQILHRALCDTIGQPRMLNSDHILTSLITLCIGFIIAFGLQQMVDRFLRRRRDSRQGSADTEPHNSTDDPGSSQAPPPPTNPL